MGGVNAIVDRTYPGKKLPYTEEQNYNVIKKQPEHQQRGLIFKMIDLNFDGNIDFYEFFKFVM